MTMYLSRTLAVMCALVCWLIAACGDSTDRQSPALDADAGILQFVPSDTPYVFARTGELPDGLIEKVEPQVDAVLKAYHSIISGMLDDAYAKARAEGDDLETFESLLPLVDELGSLLTVEGLRDAGTRWNTKMAMYGAGLLPVVRIELDDEVAFEAAIGRLETSADRKMARAAIDGHSYRYSGDEKGRVVLGIFDGYFVMAMVPTELPEDDLKTVLGLTLPATSIAASGNLKSVADEYEFENYMVGLVDVQRLARPFVEPASGLDATVLGMLDYDPSSLSEVCRAEIMELAGVMPRFVTGYTEISESTLGVSAIAELRSDLANGMRGIAGAVPGLGSRQGGLMSFGMSVDLLAAREFYASRLDAMEADPYQCELFADLQNGIEGGRDVLNQPVPPIVYGFKGFLAVIDAFDGNKLGAMPTPGSVKGRFLVAMENAEGLLAMGAMFSPEIATLNLQPDGKPVRLDVAQLAAAGDAVYIAMTEDALAFSTGDGLEKDLPAMLAASPASPSPFLTMDMDAGRYYAMVADAMAEAPADEPTNPEVQAAGESLIRIAQQMLDRVAYQVYLTGKGIEINTDVTLKD